MTNNEKTKIERDLKQRVKSNSVGSTSSNTDELQKTVDRSTRSDSAGRILTSSENTTPLEKLLRSVDKSTQINKSRSATISEEIATYGALARKNTSIDASRFWKQHGSQMPLLKEQAQ